MPHLLPVALWRRLCYGRVLNIATVRGPVYVALTFDVEQDFGSLGEQGVTTTSRPFLQEFGALCNERGWVATFFIQGDLVESLAQELSELVTEHEIGLHGFHHELWGRPKWFLPQKPIEKDEKRLRLNLGLKAFQGCGLPRPISFRAPSMVIDGEALKLLEELDFRVDSSASSYLGVPPVPRLVGKIVSLPVSVSPIPRFVFKGILPTFAPYVGLSLQNLLELEEGQLLSLVREILAYQISQGYRPHLITLAHPWEFYENGLSPFCSRDNFRRLSERLGFLEENFRLRYVSLHNLASRLLPGRIEES